MENIGYIEIGKNIAKYRKAKNLTQEELGVKLGVTNQAVSKWEQNSSLPDVTMLPYLCKNLDITLDQLYGIEKPEEKKISADDFPRKSYENLVKLFVDNSKLGFNYNNFPQKTEDRYKWFIEQMKDDVDTLMCISDTAGATYISESFSFVDTTYKAANSEKLFTEIRLAKLLTKLADKNVRKVLAYLYKNAFERSKNGETEFTLAEITDKTQLDEEDANDALDILTAMEITVSNLKDGVYYFNQSQAVYALAIYKCAVLLDKDKAFLAVRDTKMITDCCFWE